MRTLPTLASAALFMGCAARALAAEPVTIGGVTYDQVDPGEPFTQRPRPAHDWGPPEPTAAERAAGMIAFATDDPGDYKPYRVPRAEEHASGLSAFLAQGEHEPVWFGVHAVDDLNGLSLTVDVGSTPVTVDVRHMHFWPQRTGWRSRQWYVTPELLLPCRDGTMLVPARRGVLREQTFDLPTGETAAFWLTLHAAEDAPAGSHDASVVVTSRGHAVLTIPLQIEVLPFKLRRPDDRHWLLYGDCRRWTAMSDAQVLAELRDFARHGMTGLVEMPLGRVDVSGVKSGDVTFDAGAFVKLAAQCREAGLPGPHVCSYGGTPARVSQALGVTCDLRREEWPEPIREGVAAVARAAVEATKAAPTNWLFYGVDEPSGDNTYAIQEYQCWRRGGAATYATFYTLGFLDRASEFLTAPCFGVGLVSKEAFARAAREGCAKNGAEFWWYGTGSYVNPFPQEGFMFHNRYGAGYLFWKTGAKAQVSWTFCRPHEDVFNDFDGTPANSAEPKEQATSYPHLLKPDDWSTYQGAIPTIAWESLREGVDDYSYLHMLGTLIEEGRRSRREAARRAATEAEETFKALIDAIPWRNPMGTPPAPESGFGTKRMQQVRRAVADLIVDLRAVVSGNQRGAPTQRAATISLVVKTVEAGLPATTGLPVIPVMPTTASPKIDGDLSDACWKESAEAGDFSDAGAGSAAGVATEARILYDKRALYVGINCAEPATDKLVAKQHGHDTPMVWLDDGVEFFIAGSDRGRYAHVIVNTNGSAYDEIGQDPSWDPDLDVAVRKERNKWMVELALPWDDLERAGITRAAAMAVNFCRNRFAGPGASPHSAWSCTYGGFHAPKRFGTALLQEGPVALADLRVPRLWGKQHVVVGLRNLTNTALSACVGLSDGRMHTVEMPAAATRPIELPIDLSTPGPATTALTWGVVGKPLREVALAMDVPEPISLTNGTAFVVDGDRVEMLVSLQIAPSQRRKLRIRVAAAARDDASTIELPARPGVRKQATLNVSGAVRLQASLVDEDGKQVSTPLTRMVFPLSR